MPQASTASICKKAGVRYLGSTDRGSAVCLTLTPDTKRVLEIGFDTSASCTARSSSGPLNKEFSGVLPELGADGRIRDEIPFYDKSGQKVAAYVFSGHIRGAAASGVLSNKGFCESLEVKWSARRVGSSAAPTQGACVADGARWTVFGQSGTNYDIDRDESITCAFAKRWVARLSGKRVRSGELRIPGGPRASVCSISTFGPDARSGLAWAGNCWNERGANFSWGPHGLR